MAHKHNLYCIEIVGGKPVCIASGKEVVHRGPRMRKGYAYKYVNPGYASSDVDWDRVRHSTHNDWEDDMVGESQIKGARHQGLMNLSAGGGAREQYDVWKAKDGNFYAQTHF
jgi:hypothetical protein